MKRLTKERTLWVVAFVVLMGCGMWWSENVMIDRPIPGPPELSKHANPLPPHEAARVMKELAAERAALDRNAKALEASPP